MRIAYVTDQLLPQNATDTQQMVSMAAAMGAQNAAVTLVVPRRWGQKTPAVEEVAAYYQVEETFALSSVRSVYPFIRGVEKVAQAYRGVWFAEKQAFDLIYTRTLPILIAGLTTTTLPVLYETYRPWPRQKPNSRRFFEWVGQHAQFLGGVFHSEYARSSYVASGMAPEKVLTAYNGYNPNTLLPRLSRETARQQLSLPQDRCILTYAGRISPKKGLHLVLDAAAHFSQHHFLLIGSEGQGEIEARAATLANVTVLPWQTFSETVPYLFASDVLLIPPTSGPLKKVGNTVLPIKTFLYLATSRAILAPATPDLTELLTHNQEAYLVTPDQQSAFFEAINTLANDTALRGRLGQRAGEMGASLTWENRAKKVLAFMDSRLKQ